MIAKTLDQEFEEWKETHFLTCQAVGEGKAKWIFLDGFEAGHKAASQHALSSIAKAFTPEPA